VLAKYRAELDMLQSGEESLKALEEQAAAAREVYLKGTLAGPLLKVASGGELSRFLLALKVVLADRGSAPVLIFDEIDTGVGGAVADAIGRRLSRLAQKVQVISVTHAPQVAARAQSHLLIEKQSVAEGAFMRTHVKPLDGAARREEVARMLAGAKVTEEARAAAGKLISEVH
jgi:DNA repair protein RecN (Recombination protein N)